MTTKIFCSQPPTAAGWHARQSFFPSATVSRSTLVCSPQPAHGSALYLPDFGGGGIDMRWIVNKVSSGARRISLILVLSSRWKCCCSWGGGSGDEARFRRFPNEPSASKV